MTIDELNVRLTADIRDLMDRLNQAERELEELGNTSTRATERATQGFDNLRSVIGTLGIGKMLKEVVTAAGELEQNLGGSSAVFKEYAKDIQQYAAQAYQTMGLSQSQYLATANKMGALFQGSGFSIAESVDLTSQAMQRAADVASIMGIDVGSAMEAVAGAAKGNFTMMDNLGVAINDTTLQIYAQEKGLGKLETTQQKVNAAMQMFLETSEYAAGNYAKENETFAGSLQTFKAELLDAAATIGTSSLPATSQGVQLFGDVLKDLTPAIVSVSTGIATIGSVLQILENPAARSIAYITLATVGLNKMKLALGGTASGLVLLGTLLTFVLGRYMETQQAAEETMSAGMNDAAISTDKATASTDKLNESMKGVEATAKALTAPFDEITKLSGGSSSGALVNQLLGDNAEQEISDVVAMAEVAKGTFEELAGTDLTPKFNFEKLKDDLEGTVSDIEAVFTGTSEESYNALKSLTDRVKSFFGAEFVDFWKGVGGEINKVFTGTGDERYAAFKSLSERIEQLPFGKELSENFQKIGQALHKMVEGVKLLVEGDYQQAGLAFMEATRSFGEGTHNEGIIDAADFGSAILKNDADSQNLVIDPYVEKVQKGLEFWVDSAQIGDFTGLNKKWDDFWIGMGNRLAGNVSDPPASAKDMYTITSGVQADSAQFQINVTVDEEVVGRTAINYSNGQIETTNGRQGG